MGDPAPVQVTVQTESRNLKIDQFVHTADQPTIGVAWQDWLEELEREFRFFKITEARDKKDALIIYGGKEIARLAKSLPDPAQGDEYQKTKEKLNSYYMPKKNKAHARYLFSNMRRTHEETTVAYAARLREKAADCEFGTNHDERILEHLTLTVDNERLVEKTVNKDWDLNQFLTEAAQMEDIRKQMKDIGKQQRSTNRVQKFSSNKKGRNYQSSGKPCDYCGKAGVHPPGKDWPAYGKKCKRCNRWNHFAVVCSADLQADGKAKHNKPEKPTQSGDHKKKWKKSSGGKKHQGKIKKAAKEDEESTTSDDEFVGQTVKHLEQVKPVKKISNSSVTVPVIVDDVEVRVEPDTGADENIMDEHQYKAFIHRSKTNVILSESKVELGTLQSSLPVKGEFQTTVRNQTRGVDTRFIVIKGRIRSPPLLCRKTLMDLGMIDIRPDGSLAASNGLRSQQVSSVKTTDINMKTTKKVCTAEEMGKEFPEALQGIGQIANKKTGEEIFVRFNMKEEAAPIAQKPRQVPYYLQKPLKKWLDTSVENGILEKVPEGEAVTWCSPLVVQPKPRYKGTPGEDLEPHMVRASVDLRVPNKYMDRNRISEATVVEDFEYKFHKATVFTKLDMRSGYHQLSLHPESRSIATFSSPWGNYRPTRLIFGAKASQDLFDETIFKIFGDIPNCLNHRDDILIGG